MNKMKVTISFYILKTDTIYTQEHKLQFTIFEEVVNIQIIIYCKY